MLKIHNNNNGLSKRDIENLSNDFNTQAKLFYDYLKDHNLKTNFKHSDFDYYIESKYEDKFSDAMVNPDENKIIFYGTECFNLILHEWTHLAFPNYNCSRHAEGFANFVLNAIDKEAKHNFTINNSLSLIENTSIPDDITDKYNFIRNGKNFYNREKNINLASRAISTLFIDYLISKYGIIDYMKQFYNVYTKEASYSSSEKYEFTLFINNLMNGLE